MASKKEISVEDKLRQLYALQEIDTQLDQIEILKGELPMEVSDLEDEIVGLETRIKKLSDAVDEVQLEITNHKTNIKNAEALMKRYNQQLDEVKNNREYDALSKEIELQKLEVQLSEKKIKEAQTVIETKQETLDEAKGKLDEKQENLKLKQEELKKIIAKTDKEEKSLNKKSDAARKVIQDRLLSAYNKIRTNYRNGLAVVTVERDACGGCFNQIPPQTQLEISLRKKIIACEHCGRILVDNEIAGVEQESAEA